MKKKEGKMNWIIVMRRLGTIVITVSLAAALCAQGYLDDTVTGAPIPGDYDLRTEKYKAAGDVIRTIPLPDTTIMGIEWVRDTLYVMHQAVPFPSDFGYIFKIDPADGNVLAQFTLPFSGNILGLAFDGKNLWVAKYSSEVGVYKITTSGALLSFFAAPGATSRGLSWDGEYLWIGDAPNGILYQVDTLGGVIRTVDMSAVIGWEMGMVWVPTHTDGHLWVNDYINLDVNQLNVSDSVAVLIQDFPHPGAKGNQIKYCSPEGICHDGEHLWVGDFYTDSLWQVDDGISEGVVENTTPEQQPFLLEQNYPNPFSQRTVIRYTCPCPSEVSLKIFDVTGRLTKALVKEPQSAGIYTVNWDGKDWSGKKVKSGIYFYRLEANGVKASQKLVLLR